MLNALLHRLDQFEWLSSDDKAALKLFFDGRPRHIGARQPIVREGEELHTIPYIARGWACRYKHLEDGRCQFLSFFLPGDLCSFEVPVLSKVDHSIRTITDAIVLDLKHERLEALIFSHPRLARAFRWAEFVQAAISREWILSLGQRTAKERCAHFICEVFWRLRAVGLSKEMMIEFPLTQEEIGGAIGVSTVHVNRMLQELRGAGLILQAGRKLEIVDLQGLEKLALFNSHFLHLSRDERRLEDRSEHSYNLPNSSWSRWQALPSNC